MVATVTVWFFPSRTIGSMHEATVLALIALLYAGVISFASMGVSVFFAERHLLEVGKAIVLIVFLGGGLGFIAWVKQRMGHPLVNVATALASLGCIIILIREGSVQGGNFSVGKAAQVLCMVIVGIALTTAVNVILLPSLARKRLSKDVEKNTDLLGEMLISIARAFLHGREMDLQDDYYKQLSSEHQDSLKAMHKNLGEAKREHLLLGSESVYLAEARLVECLTGLSQDLGGLRSAALAQFAFLNDAVTALQASASDSTAQSSPIRMPVREEIPQTDVLGSITEDPEDWQSVSNSAGVNSDQQPGPNGDVNNTTSQRVAHNRMDNEVTPTENSASENLNLERTESIGATSAIIESPSDMFMIFIKQLGPPTKSLVFTLKQILDELPFRRSPKTLADWNPWADRELEVAVNEQFHSSLRQAIDLYRQSRNEALNTLYQNRAINATVFAHKGGRPTFTQRRSSSNLILDAIKPQAPQARPESSREPGEIMADIEEVSACCGHFSFSLLDFAESVQSYLDILEDMKLEMESPRHTWKWLLFWRHSDGTQYEGLKARNFHDHGEESTDIPFPIQRADDFANPDKSSRGKPWYYGIYKALHVFRQDDVRFAIKVGMGAALYALPAFLDDTRPFFMHWRGEWGLVSYMAVCCMTIGAANTTGINRFIGTFIGAILAIIVWIISSHDGDANPWILGFFGWLVSLGCFHLILAKNNGPMGRFILLTYNLGALYSYSLSVHDDDNDDDEGGINPVIWEIVMHRFLAVVIGTLWGIIVTRWIWPISARNKLREGLCLIWLRMGLIWKRDPLAMFLLGEPQTSYMDIREEAELQSFLGTLKGLQTAARSEFELRGPFPDKIIGRILDHIGRMLDAFHAMNVVISKNLRCTPGEAAVLRYTRPERFALSARISHLFTVLASSIKLEYPLNDVLPSIENSRDRMLAKLSEYRQSDEGKELTSEQDYELLYAYVLVTGQLAKDIQAASNELETLFGTLNEENLKLQ